MLKSPATHSVCDTRSKLYARYDKGAIEYTHIFERGILYPPDSRYKCRADRSIKVVRLVLFSWLGSDRYVLFLKYGFTFFRGAFHNIFENALTEHSQVPTSKNTQVELGMWNAAQFKTVNLIFVHNETNSFSLWLLPQSNTASTTFPDRQIDRFNLSIDSLNLYFDYFLFLSCNFFFFFI